MKFGEIPVREAAGAVLAHSLRIGSASFKKGRVLSGDDIEALASAGLDRIAAVRLEAGDLGEDEAAVRIAEAVRGENVAASVPGTGRCNLYAERDGLAVIDADAIDRVNAVDESVTVATVPRLFRLKAGEMVATVKIITFAVAGDTVERCRAALNDGPPVRVAAFRPLSVGLVQTRLPGTKETVIEKTVEVTRARLAAIGATLAHELRCSHDEAEVAQTLEILHEKGCDIALALGASAIADRHDVIPAAIARCGGNLEHFGMPVDPGNLMLLAGIGDMRVLGLPGSARSPRLHGFDWVLERIAAGIEVTGTDLARMGVGGLLKEIPGRPMPRDRAAPRREPRRKRRSPRRVAALVLAAGRSQRMGPVNKLLADIGGRPMVSYAVDATTASACDPVIVVTGHEPDRLREALSEYDVRFVHNPDYAGGLSTSLRAGISALDDDVEGAVICLGDMPTVTASLIDRLIEAFDPDNGAAICVPTFNGKRGNPVLWARRYFAEMTGVSGDVGARHLIGEHEESLCEVPMADDAILTDLDTPAALAAHKAAREAET